MAELIRQIRGRATGEHPRYRVWNAINPPSNMDFYSVNDPEEAYHLIEKLILRQMEDPEVASNAFGLEELEDDGEYREWYNDDGDCEDIQSTIAFGKPMYDKY